MAQIRKTTEELLADEEKKSEQVRARMAELKARQRAEERKKDTHRKVLAGATLMAHVKIDPPFRRAVQVAFNKALTDPKRRAVLADLLDETAFNEARQAAANKATIEAREAQQTVTAAPKPPAPPAHPQRRSGGPDSGGPSLA